MSNTVVISTLQTGESSLANEIARFGVSVLLLPHIYHLAETSPVWDTLRNLPAGTILLVELHPRATEWVLHKHGVSAEVCLDLRRDDIKEALLKLLEPAETVAGSVQVVTDETIERWYPLMDNDRCQQCGHCKQFCLFGVYSQDEDGRIFVDNPDSCKPGCPACSRICPHGAIIFPLYAKEPAIAGAPGQYMVLDLAARKLFYQRTKLACPVCGLSAAMGNEVTGEQCEECGRFVPTTTTKVPDDVTDELDALVDALDNLPKRGR